MALVIYIEGLRLIAIADVDIPFVVVVVDERQMGEDKYLSRQPGLRQM